MVGNDIVNNDGGAKACRMTNGTSRFPGNGSKSSVAFVIE